METAGIGDDRARELLMGVRGLVRRFSVAERADVACCGVTVAQARPEHKTNVVL